MSDVFDDKPVASAPPKRRRMFRITMGDVVVGVLLLATVLIGGYARFMANNWDDFVRFHPDERFLTMIIAPNLGRQMYVNCPKDSTGYSGCHPDDDERYERQQMCLERYPNRNGAGDYFDTACSLLNPENIERTHFVYGTLPLFFSADGRRNYGKPNE